MIKRQGPRTVMVVPRSHPQVPFRAPSTRFFRNHKATNMLPGTVSQNTTFTAIEFMLRLVAASNLRIRDTNLSLQTMDYLRGKEAMQGWK